MSSPKPVVITKSPFISPLRPGKAFDRLTEKEKLYAHHLSRAAWHGTRIILRQVSPESNAILDFILALYRSCAGNWSELAAITAVSMVNLRHFLEFSAMFLGNVGNYFGQGDQKFIPNVTEEFLKQISKISETVFHLYEQIEKPISADRPLGLGLPSDIAQSSYYPGDKRLSLDELAAISDIMGASSLYFENTRVQKHEIDGRVAYDVLQASIQEPQPKELQNSDFGAVRLIRGDHKKELQKICGELLAARNYAANSAQDSFLSLCYDSFITGDIECYKESQRLWVKDLQPSVEVILGFVEPYRDPMGIRAEFEGLVAITDREETQALTNLVDKSDAFIRRLPWALLSEENGGKGPFEKELFEKPDFTSLHTLTYNSSIIFPGINLPNYNDIRQEVGFKNVMITNSMTTRSPNTEHMANLFEPSEVGAFLKHRDITFYLWVVFHELLGHGTSKLLTENPSGFFNFDPSKPPRNPLTGKLVTSWYRPGQTWTGLFGDIATTVDECRAECVGAYLMSDMELLSMFGYTSQSNISGRDLEYNMYLLLGGSGLRALENYNVEDQRWGQAHSRAHFAILRTLLAAKEDFLTITHDKSSDKFTVRVDRSKIATHGRPALSELLLKLHIYRCTADVSTCREFYEDLTTPNETFLQWRQILLKRQPAKQVFVQPNTMMKDGKVVVKEYEATVDGVIQSWVERMDMLELGTEPSF